MDTVIYGITVGLTVIWSVWNDALWRTRIGLDEGSAARMINVAGPSVYFLLVAIAGWQLRAPFRLDLIGLMTLDAMIVLSSIVIMIVLRLRLPPRRKGYIWIISLFHILAIVVTVLSFAVAKSPLLLIRLSSFAEDVRRLDFFSLTWAGVEGSDGERDIAGLLNKIIIALLSYIPVSLIRFAAAARQKKKLLREIGQLSVRMLIMEKTVKRLEDDERNSNT